jgi:protein-disulfide isomerase
LAEANSSSPTGAPNVTLASTSLTRRALTQAVVVALTPVLLGSARADTAPPKPDSSVDMTKVLQPGPLPELSVGDAAGIPVIEYGSLTCPHCAHFAKEIWPAFKAAFVDTGKVRYIFREYSRNNLDVAAFMLARCVGDDKAFPTIELLFAEQEKWAFVDKPLDGLTDALRPTGMTRDKIETCLKDQKMADAVSQIGKTADATVKVTGTPTFVIDGKVYGGALTNDDLAAILKPLIK